jgi:hypothetical protein
MFILLWRGGVNWAIEREVVFIDRLFQRGLSFVLCMRCVHFVKLALDTGQDEPKGGLQYIARQNRGSGKAGRVSEGEKSCCGLYSTCVTSNRWTNAVYV